MAQTTIEFTVANWSVIIDKGLFHISNINVLQSQGRDCDHHIFYLPFTLEELMTKFVTFGLTTSLDTLVPFSYGIPLLVQTCHKLKPSQQVDIIPKILFEKNRPISFTGICKDSLIQASTISLTILFINSIPRQFIAMYVPPVKETDAASVDLPMCECSDNYLSSSVKTRVWGPAIQTSKNVLSMLFINRLSEICAIETIRFNYDSHVSSNLKLKYIEIDPIDQDMYKINLTTVGPCPLEALTEVQLIQSPESPAIILSKMMPFLCIGSICYGLSIYPETPKTINPGETIKLKIKNVYSPGDNASGKPVFIITGTDPMLKLTTTTWFPMEVPIMEIQNISKSAKTVDQFTPLAIATPLLFDFKDLSVDNSTYGKFYDRALAALYWDDCKITAGPGGIVTQPIPMQLIHPFHPSPMIQ